ncbi:MAG: restriction endonuclease subunit S [Thermoleophilia bacterium]|nr:restriction endonuclease subunit S [Thermoleophilia bacterium]
MRIGISSATCQLSFPLDEQRAITAFLDRETSRIDALIEKKRRQIELLNEKRAALISHAVTKGLDPNAPMKDSGIDWLGELPAHWELKRLKLVSVLQTGLTLGKKYVHEDLVPRPYLRVANVQDGYLDLETVTEIELPLHEARRYELELGDVLMTEGGDFDKLGRGYVWEGQIPRCLHQNHIFAVRPNAGVLNPRFLAAVLMSSHGKNYFTSTSQQTTNLATTNSTKLRSFPVPLPALSEQVAILARVQGISGHLESLIRKVDLSIDRLREYRTALISAAVTGKIDVRQEAAG